MFPDITGGAGGISASSSATSGPIDGRTSLTFAAPGLRVSGNAGLYIAAGLALVAVAMIAKR